MENFPQKITNSLGFIEEFSSNDSLHLKNKQFKIYHNSIQKLVNAQKPSDLCKLFQCSFEMLQQLILKAEYSEFEIPKKNNSSRKIQAPNEQLKEVQTKLNDLLQVYYYYWFKPKFVHGFVIRPKGETKMCNIVSNAQAHVGKKFVLNIDLKDFFSSISSKRVYELFSSKFFSYNDNIAKSLTFLTTYKGFLPTGAPTSPVISNFICINLDIELNSFCQKHELSFSRYADDLTFSANNEFSPSFIAEIKTIIEKHDLHVNSKKVYIKKSNRKQTVTGLIVNEKVNIDRKLLKKIRAMLHALKTKGVNQAAYNHFKGRDGKNGQIDHPIPV